MVGGTSTVEAYDSVDQVRRFIPRWVRDSSRTMVESFPGSRSSPPCDGLEGGQARWTLRSPAVVMLGVGAAERPYRASQAHLENLAQRVR